MRNRKLICEWCYERGKADNVIEMVRENGKRMSWSTIMKTAPTCSDDMLREVQRIKSEGDYEPARRLSSR